MTDSADLDALAQRYIDLWQEQLAQISADPAVTQAWGSAFQNAAQSLGWTPDAIAATTTVLTAAFTGHSPSGAEAEQSDDGSAGSAASASASDDGGDGLAAVLRRLDALEQRFAALQADQGRD